jgi:hypothetical protein
MCPDDIDGLLNAAPARHDIFGKDIALTFVDPKTTAQNETAGFFLNEDVPLPQRAPHLLTDDGAAEGRGDYGVTAKFTKTIGKHPTDTCCHDCVLEEQSALKILPAMQAGTQNKMAIKQRAGLPKQREKIFAHDFPGSARASRADKGAPAFANFNPAFRRGRQNEHARARALPRIRNRSRRSSDI